MCCSGGISPGGKNCSCVWLFGAQCSIALARGQQFKRERELGVRGPECLLSPVPHSGGVMFLEM